MLPARLVDRIRQLCGYRFPRMGRLGNQLFWKSIPREMRSEIVPGIEVDLNFGDSVCKGTFKYGAAHEWPTLPVLEHWVRAAPEPARLFFDIGSNYGYFSYFLMSRLPGLTAYAFEPNPDTFQRLETIKRENRLAHFLPQNLGLGETEGQLDFYPALHNTGDSSFMKRDDVDMGEPIPVPVLPFAAWIEREVLRLPSSPAWVAKIDVEGYEKYTLRGMAPALEARAFAGICLEMLESTQSLTDGGTDSLIVQMESYGYRRVMRVDRWDIPDGNTNAFFVPEV
ncbi:MAG: FkbM family methyltransferase [Verrucomicrobiota bacterium]